MKLCFSANDHSSAIIRISSLLILALFTQKSRCSRSWVTGNESIDYPKSTHFLSRVPIRGSTFRVWLSTKRPWKVGVGIQFERYISLKTLKGPWAIDGRERGERLWTCERSGWWGWRIFRTRKCENRKGPNFRWHKNSKFRKSGKYQHFRQCYTLLRWLGLWVFVQWVRRSGLSSSRQVSNKA